LTGREGHGQAIEHTLNTESAAAQRADIWYLALDGDDIGRSLELHIVNNDIEMLQQFSAHFTNMTERLDKKLLELPGVRSILNGGDSLLFSFPHSSVDTVISTARDEISSSDFSFSGGYGPSPRSALLALKIAKSSGKNRIQGPELTT
jgi:hypothetical protein